MTWKKANVNHLANGEQDIIWISDGADAIIESRKRLIPHAGGRSGGWFHTTYWVIQPDGTEKEYWRMSEAKEAAEHGTKRIKCIIKRPDEQYGHVTNISCSLENLQKTVEGYIEAITLGEGVVIICNEEGKIKGLQPNFRIGTGWLADTVCGTVIVIGVNEDEFTDLPIDFAGWKRILKGWGN